MQNFDPKLASAVSQMPPQVAHQVVLQYTNAIRMGKETEASTLASQAAKAGLDAFAQSQAAAPKAGPRIGRLSLGMQPQTPAYGVSDSNTFDKALQHDPSPMVFGGSPLRKSGIVLSAVTPAVSARQEQAKLEAFKNVKDKYNAYNLANQSEYEKGLIWQKPKDKEITVPSNWSIPQGAEQLNPFDNTAA